MIIRVPITGKLLKYDPKTKKGEGDKENPLRPLAFDKLFPGAFFEWKVLTFDIESATALVELTFRKVVTVTAWDKTKEPHEPLAWKTETDTEFFTRQAEFNKLAWDMLVGKTPDELYQLTGEPKLEMP